MQSSNQLSSAQVRQRIYSVMEGVRSQIMDKGQEPVFEVLDFSQLDSFDEDSHCLVANLDKRHTKKVRMLQHPFHFSKLLMLLDFIDKSLAKNESRDQHTVMKKRAVYYSLVGQGVKSTEELDEYIADLCHILDVSRDYLCIEASIKTLIAGANLTSTETVEYIQLPAYLLHQKNQQAVSQFESYFKNLCFVLIVEKETVFQHVTQMQWFRQIEEHGDQDKVLILTAKGYPDFATRQFLQKLAELVQGLRMFYLGDADPFGAEIFMTYLFGSLKNQVVQNSSRCQTLYNLEWIGPFMQDLHANPQSEKRTKSHFLKLTDTDQLKAYTLLSKPYLEDTYIHTHKNDQEKVFKEKLLIYKRHLMLMVEENRKFEVEALSCQSDDQFQGKEYRDQLEDLIQQRVLSQF